MKMNQILKAAAAVLILGSSSAVIAGGHGSDAPAVAGEGACTYTLENAFGVFAMCEEPNGAESCNAKAGAEGPMGAEYSEVSHADGACPTEGRIGTCTVEGLAQHYYDSGDSDGLETGCMFSSGDWTDAE
ncbi:MAG: hypothetical protein HKN56_03100 [Gammaproteobacteria bacterium]|nr:hypothetical protein [Gammaproteobacteria bacterium]NND53942.1 hypothetical protein [Gammaproteobacteria bacterium]